jgi:hypothetical protein
MSDDERVELEPKRWRPPRWRPPDEDWEDPRIARAELRLLDDDDDGLGERMHESWLAERGL